MSEGSWNQEGFWSYPAHERKVFWKLVRQDHAIHKQTCQLNAAEICMSTPSLGLLEQDYAVIQTLAWFMLGRFTSFFSYEWALLLFKPIFSHLQQPTIVKWDADLPYRFIWITGSGLGVLHIQELKSTKNKQASWSKLPKVCLLIGTSRVFMAFYLYFAFLEAY